MREVRRPVSNLGKSTKKALAVNEGIEEALFHQPHSLGKSTWLPPWELKMCSGLVNHSSPATAGWPIWFISTFAEI